MPDARVQAAVSHWGPRFIQAGVEYGDFLATMERIETWDEWLDEWCVTGDMHAGLAREAEEAGRARTAGEAWVRAAVGYHFAKFVWVLDRAKSRGAADRAVDALRRAHPHLDPTAERIEAPVDGGRVVANLRRPPRSELPPLAVLIPGLDSTKEEFFRFEEFFLNRGMATLSMDGPGQGECGYDLPIRHDYEVGLAAALDAVAGRDDLDLERIGAVGVSLGGYYAPRAAAFEPRVRAVVGLSGPFCFGELWDGRPQLTRETFAEKSGASSEDEAREKALELDLDGVIERLDKPALFVTGRLDRLVPWEQTAKQAKRAPQGTFVCWDEGNHGCSNIPYKARSLMADWMAEQLG
ncbi:MAG TPA: alpha/beta fold hydrolase [Thermoleophilaceae bacterium]|nr:alpha/beta fold hydrolase [Thermoleophilaceae bacterium]